MTTADILQAHLARMNEIADSDVKHTESVQGCIKHVAERFLDNGLKVADKLETITETKEATA